MSKQVDTSFGATVALFKVAVNIQLSEQFALLRHFKIDYFCGLEPHT